MGVPMGALRVIALNHREARDIKMYAGTYSDEYSYHNSGQWLRRTVEQWWGLAVEWYSYRTKHLYTNTTVFTGWAQSVGDSGLRPASGAFVYGHSTRLPDRAGTLHDESGF